MWSATVNGAAVVPVMAGGADPSSAAAPATNSTAVPAPPGGAAVSQTPSRNNTYLIPLPQHADPDAVLTIDLNLAERSADPKLVSLTTPFVAAPVMLAEWKLQPDDGQRLIYRSGTLSPAGVAADVSGFAEIRTLARGGDALPALESLARGTPVNRAGPRRLALGGRQRRLPVRRASSVRRGDRAGGGILCRRGAGSCRAACLSRQTPPRRTA